MKFRFIDAAKENFPVTTVGEFPVGYSARGGIHEPSSRADW